MSDLRVRCPHCKISEFISGGYCTNFWCPTFRLPKTQNVQSSNSNQSEEIEDMPRSDRNMAPSVPYQAPPVVDHPTGQLLRFPTLAEYGRIHPPASAREYQNFNNAQQALARNQLERNFQANVGSSGAAAHNSYAGQGSSYALQEPRSTQGMCSSGLPFSPASVAQSLSYPSMHEPQASRPSARSQPGPSGKQSSAQKISTPPRQHNSDGFCVMCEVDCSNIYIHWSKLHKDENGENKHCYTTTILFKYITNKRLLLPKATNHRELKKCLTCQKVFYNHRYDNHGCPVPPTSSAQSNASSTAPVPASGYEIKGSCSMCKYFFDDLNQHWSDMHNYPDDSKDDVYDIRKVRGQWTLLPYKTCDDKELYKCLRCLKILYIHSREYFICDDGSKIPLCRTCLPSYNI